MSQWNGMLGPPRESPASIVLAASGVFGVRELPPAPTRQAGLGSTGTAGWTEACRQKPSSRAPLYHPPPSLAAGGRSNTISPGHQLPLTDNFNAQMLIMPRRAGLSSRDLLLRHQVQTPLRTFSTSIPLSRVSPDIQASTSTTKGPHLQKTRIYPHHLDALLPPLFLFHCLQIPASSRKTRNHGASLTHKDTKNSLHLPTIGTYQVVATTPSHRRRQRRLQPRENISHRYTPGESSAESPAL